ncbi:MAG: thioesterase family protein [Bacteroidota bacterium]|nr:thioesterase family protein [Bacteroidota bacterium]
MYSSETKIRVRYGETDKMGYVYYGNYPLYFEVARTEMIRKIGFPYTKLEEQAVMMPVKTMSIKYIRPAFYDDELTVKASIKEMPKKQVDFEYEVYNEKGKLLTVGSTTLVFVAQKTMRPINIPEGMYNALKNYF